MDLPDKTLIDDLERIAVEGHPTREVRQAGSYTHPFHVRAAAERAAKRLRELIGGNKEKDSAH